MAIDGINQNNPYGFLNGTSQSTQKQDEQNTGDLAMEDFLSLMTTQLQNQDPLKPMENGDFLGQIASFGTVSGIEELRNQFESLSNSMQSDQALQGSSLVGRSVLVPSAIGMMNGETGLQGQINVDEPVQDLKVQIYSESGSLVKTMDMGAASGATNFGWDGLDDNGEPMPAGPYQFRATGTVNGENTSFSTSTLAQVNSVLVDGRGSDGLTMNLAGIGSVPFKEVQEII